MDIRRFAGSIQNMTYDAQQNCWVAIGHQPEYRRAGILVRARHAVFGTLKTIILVAVGAAACGFFYEAAPWYVRAWSGLTGNFPWLWPF